MDCKIKEANQIESSGKRGLPWAVLMGENHAEQLWNVRKRLLEIIMEGGRNGAQ